MDFVWDDAAVEQLKGLWADGASAETISTTLGCGSRNSVIGKVHRLGLSGRAKPRSGVQTARAARPRRAPAQRVLRAAPPLAPIELPEPEILEIVPLGQRCCLHDLSDSKCRFPVGDPRDVDFFFCGGVPLEGLPYCNFHHRVCYQPAAARRDRRSLRG